MADAFYREPRKRGEHRADNSCGRVPYLDGKLSLLPRFRSRRAGPACREDVCDGPANR